MIDLSEQIVDPARYGWKAHYLSRLIELGFVVPEALAIAPDEIPDVSMLNPDLAYAVRSSGLGEDAHSNSYAGHFTTQLCVRGQDRLMAAIQDVRASAAGEMPMGVIVQEMVGDPIASGVAFSVHPVTLARNVAMVSWIHGLGEGLVSGELAGNDVEVSLQHATVSGGVWPFGAKLLGEIVDGLIRLQEDLGRPVDVEWCVSSESLILLQLRPVVLPIPDVIGLDAASAFARLPSVVAAHSKMTLRADAAQLGVPMSRARAILATHTDGEPITPSFPATERSAGRSVVLLHPTRIEGKVVREFTKDCSTDVEFFVRGCQRYAIRQYPDQSSAAQSIAHTLSIGLEHGALACVIEQEILHAYATGILRRTSEGYLVEAALGHFVPKGYVETSLFALSNDLEVTLRAEVPQSKSYHFMNGHVIVENPPYEQLSLTDADLRGLVHAMQPILRRRPGVALEFGLLGYAGAELDPYMIDVADSDSETSNLLLTDAVRGVISAGTASGHVVDLRSAGTQDDLNAHLYNSVSSLDSGLHPSIYIAQRASIDLLPIVRAAHPDSGFVFERASLLAHLSVVLRERGLAAVTAPPEAIEGLLHQSGNLMINTADQNTVAIQKVSEL